MRVLITGGAGFIGSHLADRLAGLGHDVIVLDDTSWGSFANLTSPSIRTIRASLSDLPALHGELQGVEAIYHLAALISGHDSLLDPETYFDVNVTGTLRVIELARSTGARRIVFSSSSTVYGGQAAPDKSETDVPAPQSVYALTKLAAEHLLAMYAPLYAYTFACLRLFNVYGPRQGPTHPYANVTCKFAHAAATGAAITLYGTGAQSRDFIYVDDVVAAFAAVATTSRHAVYNVGTGIDTSIKDLLSTVERIAGAPLQCVRLPPWPNDIAAIRSNSNRLRAEFGWSPQTSLNEGLRRTVQFFREQER